MRILVGEDDPVARRILEARLTKWGYHVITARDGEEARKVLDSAEAPQLAILDWMMPGMDGIEVCRRVRKTGREPYVYIVLLTSLDREEDLVAGMEAGADDYITKPFQGNELRARLRAGRRIVDLQNELIAAREELRAKAAHDPLTGLWNHEEILCILTRELARAGREGCCLAAIMADIDYFKRVNDTHGHLAGDAVLLAVARRMLALLRSYDAIGRFGGEEFLLVLPECDRESAVALAERVRLSICGYPVDTREGPIPVTISLGVAISGSGVNDADSLVQTADLALYQAKKNGRNRVEVAQVAHAAEETKTFPYQPCCLPESAAPEAGEDAP